MKLADAAGIKKGVTLYTLRHSFATHLLERQTPLRTIQALLGHSKPETTTRYAHVATGMISAVESPLDQLARERRGPGKPGGTARKISRRRNRPRQCSVRSWRSRISSATMGRHGVLPTPVTSASTS